MLPNVRTSAMDDCLSNFNVHRNLPESREDADSDSVGLGWGLRNVF